MSAPSSAEPSSPRTTALAGLERRAANHVPLSPLSFLDRAAAVWPQRTAVIHGPLRRSYAEFTARCRRLASALAARGIRPGDTVAALLPNTPEMLECHFAVPMAGAVLNAINTRLDAPAIRFILEHGEARALIVDRAFPAAAEALRGLDGALSVIEVEDPAEPGAPLGGIPYEDFLASGSDSFSPRRPADEWDAIALNYTSGTTGNPKGVVYHHRGAYLNALSNALATGLGPHTVYLWTLPMFHCNGWTFPWAVTAVGGAHVCLRRVEPEAVFAAVAEEKVTTFCAAPVILNMLLHAPRAGSDIQSRFAHRCDVFTGGAAPPSAVIEGMEQLGFTVTQLYGLTECYGPSLAAVPRDEWTALPLSERARLMARQGFAMPLVEEAFVGDPESGAPVPRDGAIVGEVLLRGNTLMKGYLKNPRATEEAFRGGCFHTGDLAVQHHDGAIEVVDRSKDIINSGGENISSLEVEEVLYRHPAVREAAVVARPDPTWGETPCAFIDLREDAEENTTEAAIVAFCRANMAHFKVPKRVIFGPLPKTATGKIQKFTLRERARQESAQQ